MEQFGFWVVSIHPGLVTSNYGVHGVGVTVCRVQHVLDVWIWPRNQRVPSFSLQWKSDENKIPHSNTACHQLTLLTGGKKFTHAYGGSRTPHACMLLWNPPDFHKRKVRYFSNRVVYKNRGKKGETLTIKKKLQYAQIYSRSSDWQRPVSVKTS